jgi:hypothetical protein
MRKLLIVVSICTLAIGLWCGSAMPIKPGAAYYSLFAAKAKLTDEDPVKHAEVIALLEEGIRYTTQQNRRLTEALRNGYSFSFIVGAVGLLCGISAPRRPKVPSPP